MKYTRIIRWQPAITTILLSTSRFTDHHAIKVEGSLTGHWAIVCRHQCTLLCPPDWTV